MKNKKLFMILLVCSFLLGFSASSVYANLLGGKWYKSTVKYKVDSSVSDYTSYVTTAASRWNNLTDIIKLERSSTYDVLIKKSSSYEQDYFAPSGVYALAIPELERGGDPSELVNPEVYEYGEIRIITRVSDELSDKASLLTHEFGHIYGLAHRYATNIYNAGIMDEAYVFMIQYPTYVDRQWLERLY